MKKKFLVFTLCFTLIFTSLNYKKSYADSGLLSLPILATVGSLAVGSGIVLNDSSHLYDIGKGFVDYIDSTTDLTIELVKSTFNASVKVLDNGLVSVDSKFLDIVKGYLDSTFNPQYSKVLGYVSNIPITNGHNFDYLPNFYSVPHNGNGTNTFSIELPNDYSFLINHYSPTSFWYGYYSPTSKLREGSIAYAMNLYIYYEVSSNRYYLCNYNGDGTNYVSSYLHKFSVPIIGGTLNWDNVLDRQNSDDKSVALPVPGDLGQLVGQGSTDFWDNTDNLVGSGDISLPNVDNPSIKLDGVTSFPSVDVPDVDSPSVPNEGIWATIKDFIINLVVPSDTYWTDTWGGLYNNFTSSFPMVDMDGFNDLVTGEKKFPNIDINIMGVTGRVVNGDVINSIVDWLRPIIAGFMMLCLMLFNYRKIYKLIRNTEPFGGIAPGTSDFRTGISEYTHVGLVNDGFKRSEDEEFARSRYYEEMYFKNGGKL